MSFRFVSRIKQFLQGLRGGGPHEDAKMQNETNGAGDAVNGDRQQLHLVIIGAGLAGLGAAVATKVANPYHQVTVLESVKELAEVGAGLQLTPNSTRLFKTWGVLPTLSKAATFPNRLSVHRFDGTKMLADEPAFQTQIDERYGAPFWGMHRVDLQRTLAARAKELGVHFRLSAKVTSVDFANASVQLESGEKVEGDVILCCDGLWSATRSQFLGRESKAKLTGDLAYRIVINVADLHGPDAAELKDFIASERVNFWAGNGTHVVAYTMRAGTVFNIVLLAPDDLPENVSKAEGDLDEMKKLFEDWDPILKKFLGQVKAVAKWKLMHLDTLPEWANKEGTFVMAGDCCHPMLPYLAQGANSSLEDGAVFGALLAKVKYETKGEQLPKMAEVYQRVRKERGEEIAKETFKQREDFHMPDGEKQEERDRFMLRCLEMGAPEADFPSRWTCPRVQKWLYGYDSYAEAVKAFKETPY